MLNQKTQAAIFLIIFNLLSVLGYGQLVFDPMQDVDVVTNGISLKFPWNGGLNSGQYGHNRIVHGRWLSAWFGEDGYQTAVRSLGLPADQEQRLLALDSRLGSAVVRLKEEGLKTEPAFASVLGLNGDPYEAMLMLEEKSDEELVGLIQKGLGED